MQDPEAAEYARAHLDEDAVVSFAGKHFVLSGYEDNMEGEELNRSRPMVAFFTARWLRAQTTWLCAWKPAVAAS